MIIRLCNRSNFPWLTFVTKSAKVDVELCSRHLRDRSVGLLPWFHASGYEQNDSYNDDYNSRKEWGSRQPPVPRQGARGTTVERTVCVPSV